MINRRPMEIESNREVGRSNVRQFFVGAKTVRGQRSHVLVGEVIVPHVDRLSQLPVLIARRTRLVGRETMTHPEKRHLMSTEERDGDTIAVEHLVIVRRKTGVCPRLDLLPT